MFLSSVLFVASFLFFVEFGGAIRSIICYTSSIILAQSIKISLSHIFLLNALTPSLSTQVIMATNRADTLDPALLRPGRLDRKIEFPNPDRRQKRMVFGACTAKMNIADEVHTLLAFD